MPREKSRTHHALGCDCQSCMAMVQATLAKNEDGTPFFTEQELQLMADLAAGEEKSNVA